MSNKAKHDGYWYMDKAEKGGCKVELDRGNHTKISSPDKSSTLIISSRLTDAGSEFAIRKWLVRFGIVLILIVVLFVLL
jgi:hypothetical protein